jgi:arginine decarboxylase
MTAAGHSASDDAYFFVLWNSNLKHVRRVLVQLKQQTFASYMESRYGRASNGPLNDFISRRNNQLYFSDDISLNDLARRYGTPLEVVYYPQITRQIQRMHTWVDHARWKTGYSGDFAYAYATKANFAADVVQTALAAGAHYETSAAIDVDVARHLWRQGILPADRLVCCNGSKESFYLDAITALRQEGCRNVVPILDDLAELEALRPSSLPFQFGVRERAVGNRDGTRPGNDRFGMTAEEIDQVVHRLDTTPHRLVLYHAMAGSQIEDSDNFLSLLHDSVVAYCRLRQRVPTLRYFNFGGGMPTSAYNLQFHFDYKGFLAKLMTLLQRTCAAYDVPVPDIIGEFGRYTVANHSLYLFEVGGVKRGSATMPDWYLINGSLMVSMPDMVFVPNQQFIVLPLTHWDAPVRPVRLAGRRTCDSDDVYPRTAQPPLMLPDVSGGLVLAVFGIGAYQQMIAGLGGAHHCLSPEPRRIVMKEVEGRTVQTDVPQQDQAAIMRLLGYQPERMVTPIPAVATQRRAS